MKVHHIIIHEIEKKANTTNGTKVKPSKSLLDVNEQVIEMMEELELRYSSLNHTTAIFDEDISDERKQMPKLIRAYNKDRSSINFLNLSHSSTNNLVSFINSVPPAKGGFLIFVDYEVKHRFIGVFLVRNKKGNNFTMDKNSNTYKISESIYIDLEHMAMAARVNCNYLDGINRYITFINKNHLDSKYFLNWFCADDTHNSADDTRALRRLLLTATPPNDEIGEAIDQQEFLNRVYVQIRNIPRGEYINLRTLSQMFFQDPEYLVNVANENDITINHEFKADKRELRKYINLTAKADNISINFPLDYLDKQKIVIKNDTVIITSQSLVKKILSEKHDHE